MYYYSEITYTVLEKYIGKRVFFKNRNNIQELFSFNPLWRMML